MQHHDDGTIWPEEEEERQMKGEGVTAKATEKFKGLMKVIRNFLFFYIFFLQILLVS